MKNFFSFLFLLSFVAAFTGCQTDEQDIATPQVNDPVSIDKHSHGDVDVPEIHDALLNHIHSQREDYDNATPETVTRPDGTVETIYMVGGDIELTKEQLVELQNMPEGQEKQYRTTRRVAGGTLANPRVIKVLGASGGSDGLTFAQRQGLRFAVANYNALGLDIRLDLEFDDKGFFDSFFYDIILYRAGNSSSASASAGWPSGGDPYQWVRVYDSFNGATDQQAEHVLGHEIGHCLGLRHTDFFNRSYSCNTGGNEGSGSMGAIHIPGTPTGYDASSQMNSCWPSGTNGEFSYYDRVALRWLF